VPEWSKPKVGPDQHAAVLKSLYSLPRTYRRKKLDARADRHTVRFYYHRKLVKVHPRVAPGQRHTDPGDFPPEQAACALRDRAFFERRAAEHGTNVGLFAKRLLVGPLPWTRMRQASRCSASSAATVPGVSSRRARSRSKPRCSASIACAS
jgi:hypothetical protein